MLRLVAKLATRNHWAVKEMYQHLQPVIEERMAPEVRFDPSTAKPASLSSPEPISSDINRTYRRNVYSGLLTARLKAVSSTSHDMVPSVTILFLAKRFILMCRFWKKTIGGRVLPLLLYRR